MAVTPGTQTSLLVTAVPYRTEAAVEPSQILPTATLRYEVQRHDTLWDIAERHLGDPIRWREIFELIGLKGVDRGTASVDPLKYQTTKVTAASPELLTLKLRYKEPEGDTSSLLTYTVSDNHADVTAASNNLRFASAVAEFGMLLTGSEHRGHASYGSAVTRARMFRGSDSEGYRAEFVRLVEIAAGLDDHPGHPGRQGRAE